MVLVWQMDVTDPNQLSRVWQMDVTGPNQLGQVWQVDMIALISWAKYGRLT